MGWRYFGMSTLPRVEDHDYIQFLIAVQTAFSCNEAARCSGAPDNTPAHDAFTRLLTRRTPDTETLWQEVQDFVDKTSGLLVIDDSTLDKPHARFVEKCQARSAMAQKNPILFSLRAFLQLEMARLRTGNSCYETKLSIIRDAIRNFCRSGGLQRATTA